MTVKFEFELRIADGSTWSGPIADADEVTIGRDAIADVALPPQSFVMMGRIELTLGVRDGVVWLRHVKNFARCTVDGLPFKDCPIPPGTHTIGIDEVCFALTITALPDALIDPREPRREPIRVARPPNWSADAEHILRDSDPETCADTDVADYASADAQAAFAEIVAATASVATKWRASGDATRDAAWDEFSFFKGNARWASGTALDISEAKWPHAASRSAVCNTALAFVSSRPWDGDYDEPVAARKDMLAAIAAVMARTA
ncbi:MAG: hypothetical protein JSS44_04535 [Proteobacteria bacterium]|nr:hypothetical protein [Pseudomonadota bacterium]MBS0464920.1 hypothetical protein [Pseudomonadota bacterium]